MIPSVIKIILKHIKNPFAVRQEFGDFHSESVFVFFVVVVVYLPLNTSLSHRLVFSTT